MPEHTLDDEAPISTHQTIINCVDYVSLDDEYFMVRPKDDRTGYTPLSYHSSICGKNFYWNAVVGRKDCQDMTRSDLTRLSRWIRSLEDVIVKPAEIVIPADLDMESYCKNVA